MKFGKWFMIFIVLLSIPTAWWMIQRRLSASREPKFHNIISPEVSKISQINPALEIRIEENDTHCYQIESGSPVVHIIAEQQGADIKLALFDKNGENIQVADNPLGQWSTEHIWISDHQQEVWYLEVDCLSTETSGGQYTLEILEDEKTAYDQASAFLIYRNSLKMLRGGNRSPAIIDTLREAGAFFASLEKWDIAALIRLKASQHLRPHNKQLSLEILHESLEDLKGTTAHRWKNVIYRRIARLYNADQDVSLAETMYRFALLEAIESQDMYQITYTLNENGLFYYRRGNVQKSVELLGEALDYSREYDYESLEGVVLLNMALCYSFVGKSEPAFGCLELAHSIFLEAGDYSRLATVLTQMGWARYLESEYRDAESFYRRAITMKRQVGDSAGEAAVWDRLGTTLREDQRDDEAFRAYNRALAFYSRSDRWEKQSAHVLLNLSQLNFRTGRYREARYLAQKAFDGFINQQDPAGETHALFTLARIFENLGDSEKALEMANRAFDVFESLRHHADNPVFGRCFTHTRHDYFRLTLDLLVDHFLEYGKPYDAVAFRLTERIRALSLRLSSYIENEGRTIPDSSIDYRKQSLEDSILEQDWLQSTQAPNSRGKKQDHEIQRMLATLTRLERSEKAWDESEADEIIVPEMSVLQNYLDSDTLVVVLTPGPERSYLWTIDRSRVKLELLPGSEILEPLTYEVYDLLAQGGTRLGRQRMDRLWPEKSRELGQALLSPLSHLPSYQRIIFLTDGFFNYIPFAALPFPESSYLIERHDLIHAPSFAFIVEMSKKSFENRSPDKMFAGFGGPIYVSPIPEQQGTQLLKRRLPNLTPLPGSREEVMNLANILPPSQAEIFFGFEANSEKVASMDMGRYRIIHFAAHSFLHPKYDQLSGVALSMFDPQGNPIDGMIRATRMSSWQLNADLVVLSACHTATGSLSRGEGLWGLPHVLMSVGARRVLVNLWDTHDRSTPVFMRYFYENLFNAGLTPEQALERAQQSMSRHETWSHPFYWAGFRVLSRDLEPISFDIPDDQIVE